MYQFRIVKNTNGTYEVQSKGKGILWMMLISPFWTSHGCIEFSTLEKARKYRDEEDARLNNRTEYVIE